MASHRHANQVTICETLLLNAFRIPLWACLIIIAVASTSAFAQRKSKKKPAPAPVSELQKLRDEYAKITDEYKSSLEKLIPIYERNVERAEAELEKSKKLLAEGLISRVQYEQTELALKAEQDKLNGARRQITEADAQVAGMLAETEAEKTIAKNLRLARQRLVRTTSFTRFAGGSGWGIGEAWKVQRFFSDTFKKELPIAVFGQGAIHDRWRLDHRNAMDISLHPDSAEGQALLSFLQKNGIPYLAFRSAIPGTATGPHIHIGRPSHRY
jgi:hypothetical protein